MVHDTPQPDDDDDLAALDYFAPVASSYDSDLDALALYAHEQPESTDEPPLLDASAPDEEPPSDGVVFSVTNPPGTVTVSAFLDGRVRHVDLSSKVATMTERHLAEEIVVVSRLASQDAKAAQYSVMLDGMRQQGHDDVATRDFLSRDLDLPSPEEATAARARVFATRYVGDDD